MRNATRAALAAAGLVALLALEPQPAATVAAASAWTGAPTRALVLSPQTRRYLSLQYRSSATEFLGCMIGDIDGNTVIVRRIAPADVDPGQSTVSHVIPKTSCVDAGWTGTVGMIHSHPSGERCWYFFPGTQVATSDGASFVRQPYPVDAIMCGDRVVWISRDMGQRQVPLTEAATHSRTRRVPQRGNRLQAESAAPQGED
ncbi:MAG TPA: hypothetical protein VH137_05170 [Gemmatimonadales bacterium]|jgi:hypothetical protein|nr:hypothetical protein [Gemmatimonadales bacterium]